MADFYLNAPTAGQNGRMFFPASVCNPAAILIFARFLKMEK
jgi:hypothetical protein